MPHQRNLRVYKVTFREDILVMFVFVLSISLALVRQTAPDVVSGFACVNITRCPSLERLIRNKPIKAESLEFVLSSTCGFDGFMHKVWCPQIQTKGSERRKHSPNTSLQRRVELPLSECGKQVENKIIGGSRTRIDEFPWMVVLQYKQRYSDELIAMCAGSLITNRYVLTAAHCITRIGTPAGIVLGDYHILNQTDCVLNPFGDEECAPAAIRLTPEEIKIHSGWNIREQKFIHDDIALIRLNATVEFSDFVTPICLPKPNQGVKPGVNYTVAGWGLTKNGSRSNVKLKVQVASTTREYCSKALRRDIGQGQICAGGRWNEDSCKGDSGGPLMSADLSGRWVLTGIVSLGNSDCGKEGMPAIHTFLPKYLDWILKTMRP